MFGIALKGNLMATDDPALQAILAETYLGDGLYARYDGYQIILRAPRLEGDHYVGLDSSTMAAFKTWTEELFKAVHAYEEKQKRAN
jgi:hypothetical protein